MCRREKRGRLPALFLLLSQLTWHRMAPSPPFLVYSPLLSLTYASYSNWGFCSFIPALSSSVSRKVWAVSCSSPDGRVITGTNSIQELREERIHFDMDHNELPKSIGSFKANSAVWVLQSLGECCLQLGQKWFQSNLHLFQSRRRESGGVKYKRAARHQSLKTSFTAVCYQRTLVKSNAILKQEKHETTIYQKTFDLFQSNYLFFTLKYKGSTEKFYTIMYSEHWIKAQLCSKTHKIFALNNTLSGGYRRDSFHGGF